MERSRWSVYARGRWGLKCSFQPVHQHYRSAACVPKCEIYPCGWAADEARTERQLSAKGHFKCTCTLLLYVCSCMCSQMGPAASGLC